MERTKTSFKKADAILTADWHLQETVPICRTDTFWETQWEKVDFISALQKKHQCPVLHSGDLFDFWKPSPMLLAQTIEHLPAEFHTVYGNHDLPQHNLELAYKSGIYVLQKAGCLTVLEGTHWGQEFLISFRYSQRKICVWHIGVYQGKEPWPDCPAPKGNSLIRKYDADLIVTGDFHKPFVEEHAGRLLVNPGSIFRMTADQADFRPRVYLWYADTNTVVPVYLPIAADVISREHLEIVQDRENRIEAFISTLTEDWEAEMSFEDNIERFCTKNKVRRSVLDIVYKAIET